MGISHTKLKTCISSTMSYQGTKNLIFTPPALSVLSPHDGQLVIISIIRQSLCQLSLQCNETRIMIITHHDHYVKATISTNPFTLIQVRLKHVSLNDWWKVSLQLIKSLFCTNIKFKRKAHNINMQFYDCLIDPDAPCERGSRAATKSFGVLGISIMMICSLSFSFRFVESRC